ncbi:hypothetical protein ABGV42_00525 [Paenibacillus pabuli]|uniref:hypothetical protein n=1 Tax=Paenibacillus pabuli TaxID=1472 RepID=UPI003242057F
MDLDKEDLIQKYRGRLKSSMKFVILVLSIVIFSIIAVNIHFFYLLWSNTSDSDYLKIRNGLTMIYGISFVLPFIILPFKKINKYVRYALFLPALFEFSIIANIYLVSQGDAVENLITYSLIAIILIVIIFAAYNAYKLSELAEVPVKNN